MRSVVKVVALACVLVACACPKKTTEPATTAGSGSATEAAPPNPADACGAIKGKLEQLYRADAQANEPKRIDEATADNVQMVMTDCAASPAKVTACVQGAPTVKDIETKCLARVDEAGNPLP
ncbi:hypothetical protein BH11MYX2_BH11MYX2_24420 [soil metagenome]